MEIVLSYDCNPRSSGSSQAVLRLGAFLASSNTDVHRREESFVRISHHYVGGAIELKSVE